MGKKLFLRWFFVVLLFLPLIPVFSQDSASLEKTYKVLVLHPALEVGDWPNEFNTGLYKKISGQQEINIGIIFEYLGLELIPKGISEERIIEDLRNNAGLIQPDIVISVFPGVHSLIIAHGDEIFPEIPKIFVPTIGPQFEAINSLSDSYIIKSSSEFAMRQTLEHIVTLFPKIEKLVVCSGSGENDLPYLYSFQNLVKPFEGIFEIEYLVGLPEEELLQKTSNLEQNTVIFLLPINLDNNEVLYTTDSLFPRLPIEANAPIFGFSDSPFGYGIVGGNLTSAEAYGEYAGEIALAVIRDPSFRIEKYEEVSREMYDWRALKRWNIKEDLLPPESTVLFREESFFEKYTIQILFIGFLVVFQSFWIGVLFVLLRKQKRTEILLRKNEESLERSQHTAGIGGWEYDLHHNKMTFSKEMFHIFDLPVNEIPEFEKVVEYFIEEDRPRFRQAVQDALILGKPFHLELGFISARGEQKWVHTAGKAIKEKGKISGLTGIIQDITERKEDERKLKKALDEKALLLREVHHRVKNNLAIISSFLDLQLMNLDDENMQELLKSGRNRIRAMALIHEQLYQDEDLVNINVSDYIRELVNSITISFLKHAEGIEVDLKVDSIEMNMNKLITVGLIINEIVSNSFKYAFTNILEPRISIRMTWIEQEKYLLVISDNGVGLPDPESIKHKGSVGFLLIQALIEQLYGNLTIKRDFGTEYRIEFS